MWLLSFIHEEVSNDITKQSQDTFITIVISCFITLLCIMMYLHNSLYCIKTYKSFGLCPSLNTTSPYLNEKET